MTTTSFDLAQFGERGRFVHVKEFVAVLVYDLARVVD